MLASETDKKQRATIEREAARAKAFVHPLRHRIFIKLAEREASPTELAEELGASLNNVAYHVRWLAGNLPHSPKPLIELVATDRKHGGRQHFYRAMEQPKVTIATSAAQSRKIREDVSASIVPRIVDDLTTAQEDGTLDDHPQRSVMRYHFWTDEEGMQRTAELVETHQRALEEVAAESAHRRAANPDAKGFPVAAETMVFPVAKLY
jgi:DNA-binding transcriptional ArsR family regulator